MHPLHQFAGSPLHSHFLKKCFKEEKLVTVRVKKNERRIVTLQEEIMALHFSFFAFNSIVLLLLFTSSSTPTPCRRPWVPCLCSLACSMAISWAISYKTDRRGHLKRLIEGERQYGVALVKCIEGLRKKGMEFDVMKEADTLRRTKRAMEEEEEERTSTSKMDLKMLFLLGVSCVVMGITWFKLCN